MLHWEITRNASLVRPVFHVRDRDGNPVIVGLYLDDESLYDPKHYVVGNTICIMYAKGKQFMDGSWGIRVENGKNMLGNLRKLVSVLTLALPCTLQELLDVGNYVAGEKTTCQVCGKPATQSCGRCQVVKYCSKVTCPPTVDGIDE